MEKINNLTPLETSIYGDIVKIEKNRYTVMLPNKLMLLEDSTEQEAKELLEQEKQEIIEQKGEKQEIDPRLNKITILPTTDCNLRCIYCYSRGGEAQHYLDKETAKTVINSFAEETDKDRVSIDFAGGGEPFLNFEVMKFAVEHARKKFDDVIINIVSNGTFNKEKRQWLIDNKVNTRISFDGTAQELQRPPEKHKPTVKENIEKLVKREDPITSVQTVVTSKNVGEMKENAEYLSNLGVEHIKAEPAHISSTTRGTENLVPDPKRYIDNFIEMIEHIVNNDLGMKVDSAFISRPTVGYYCGVTTPNIILTPRGKVTACPEITREEDPYSDILLYGEVTKDNLEIDEDNVSRIRNFHFENQEKCSECSFRLICNGGCPMRNFFANESAFEPAENTCKIVKNIIPRVFKLIMEDSRYSDVVFDNHDFEEC